MKIYLLIASYLLVLNPTADNVTQRFALPAGYERVKPAPNSFAAFLQSLPLKPTGTHTKTYQHKIATTDVNTAAVVDLSLGDQDLQQCADAVMRLRGEYLYHQKTTML